MPAAGCPRIDTDMAWLLGRQSVTAVALSADDQTVYSTSKDGSIFITNVESGKR